MLDQIATVQLRSHRVVIRQDTETGRIYCFKYTPSRCDMASFDSGELAGEYILEEFDPIRYYIDIPEDSEPI